MSVLLVVETPAHWPLDVPGAEVVTAREYLTSPRYVDKKRAKVFNLCRSYAYQTAGYYVSLLATARGHKPLPSVKTIQDLRLSAIVRVASEEVETLVQRALHPLESKRFELSVYFGRNVAKRYDRLCQALFDHFPAPLLRAEFVFSDKWRLNYLRPIASSEIPESHREFVIERARRFFQRPSQPGLTQPRYDLAILVDEQAVDAPSDAKAIARFTKAAGKLGMRVTLLGKADYGRIPEFDGLFLRETTAVNHHTFRFASRAAAEGLVVIDDPESIVRCTNKVYQAELFLRNGVASPKTMVVHRDNAREVGATLGLPCVLKRPDSSFSLGVAKASTAEELDARLDEFLEKSELVVAQEWTPSEFDWRVGVLDGRALWVCKYYMARGHWQIIRATGDTKRRYGQVETLAVEDAPAGAVEVAVRAASLIGDGLYGVDVKEVGGRFLVMEVNDNPNLDAGCEDKVLKDELYLAIMRTFYDRLESRGRAKVTP